MGEERAAGLLLRSLAVIPELPAVDLRTRLLDQRPRAAERRALLEAFARWSRELHEAGIDQDDTAPNNFLVDAAGRFALIDFERCSLRAGPLPDARRWTLLAKLFRHQVGVPAADKLRFLRGYLGPTSDRAARRAAWRPIRSELARLRRHDAKRAGAAAFKLGRHLEREDGGWVMRARARRRRGGASARPGARAHRLGARPPARAPLAAGAASGAPVRRVGRAAPSARCERRTARSARRARGDSQARGLWIVRRRASVALRRRRSLAANPEVFVVQT